MDMLINNTLVNTFVAYRPESKLNRVYLLNDSGSVIKEYSLPYAWLTNTYAEPIKIGDTIYSHVLKNSKYNLPRKLDSSYNSKEEDPSIECPHCKQTISLVQVFKMYYEMLFGNPNG